MGIWEEHRMANFARMAVSMYNQSILDCGFRFDKSTKFLHTAVFAWQ